MCICTYNIAIAYQLTAHMAASFFFFFYSSRVVPSNCSSWAILSREH
jgi:hypothetical protein